MKRTTIDFAVYLVLFLTLAHNWTDFPKERQVVYGKLIKLGAL